MNLITLAEVIRAVESNGNFYAMRYEPAIMDRIGRMVAQPSYVLLARAMNICSTSTAMMICATSWGAYQIMGENLYDPANCNLRLPLMTWLLHGNQTDTFWKFVGNMGYKGRFYGPSLSFDLYNDDGLTWFASRYNGPGNVAEYVARMKAAYKTLQKA